MRLCSHRTLATRFLSSKAFYWSRRHCINGIISHNLMSLRYVLNKDEIVNAYRSYVTKMPCRKSISRWRQCDVLCITWSCPSFLWYFIAYQRHNIIKDTLSKNNSFLQWQWCLSEEKYQTRFVVRKLFYEIVFCQYIKTPNADIVMIHIWINICLELVIGAWPRYSVVGQNIYSAV